MIGSLRGIVAYLGLDYCLLETPGGVGYRVFMPNSHLSQLSLNKEIRVQTHTAVREDAILLYGFLSQDYYALFELLLNVSGVGPKMALGILSAVKPEDFYLAVQSQDIKTLVKLPGIGKKTAERMLLELKDKVETFTDNRGRDITAAPTSGGTSSVAEAIEALEALGYARSEVLPTLKQIPDCSELSSDVILKQALKLIAQEKFK